MVASKLKRLIQSVSTNPEQKAARRGSKATELPAEHIREIEKRLGYAFNDKHLLAQSLTHPSYLLNTKDQLKNNQRLEFLGDSVIQLILTEKLYEMHPHHREGKLTSIRSSFARGDHMASIARELGLGQFLILKGADRDAGVADQDTALGDAFEALIGAVYLDSDYSVARKIVLSLYRNLEASPAAEGGVANPKGKLQELIQPKHGNAAIRYETTAEFGTAHDRLFEVTVYCLEQKLGVGVGRTKKEAAERAALQGLASYRPDSA